MDALAVLTRRLFDYAGMFPPASLSFEEALKESAGKDGSMRRPEMVAADMVVRPEHLSRFSAPAMRQARWPEGRTCKVALVGVPLPRVDDALDAVSSFNREHADTRYPSRVVSLEATTESTLQHDADEASGALRRLAHGGDGLDVYLEPRWDESGWASAASRLFSLLESAGGRVGLKVRCAGGTELTHGRMADVLAEVTGRELPFKATQGLHHPVVEERYGNRWGFLNLVSALRLRGVHGEHVPREQMVDLLRETDAGAFSLGGRLRWRDHEVDVGRLGDEVRMVPFSIGSCSLREPDADLDRLFG